ncbi:MULTISPECIES: type VI secretion system Vgr family protein [Pseudomonas]|uniref:Type 6 secretion system protein n=18 Tax=Pseudomonas TaxID=286 RepID=Q88JN5_PSEPK|nr:MULTISPECIES: type VI secretion system tip protein TssI/VgrG [Pseudomonas]AAN68222.1 type 6 secretion system protein [Pseudomonas putida KT2440]KMU98085.1 type VI secretion protein VgrG [Pseudomonas putida]MBP2838788.1 type VI secretion system tip protein VgrG [Pseudomonas sp. PNP]MDM3882250.1 type VI secretion system tip protein TssI/VgrG [Pseudomonas alloputida]MDM3953398.1 type VI secretion system tip protein TssI/VgrG [Pseudomonas alloputida]
MPSQSDLRYSFEALVGKAAFEVVSFELREGISAPFELELKLISFENDIDFGHLLDKPVLFTILDGERPVRYVHGLVSSFSQGESGFYRTYYHALVEPQLARARLRSNWRIFQHKTVPQILELMLKRQGIDQYELRASMDHQVREFCVQAGETDLAFIARLAAEEGFVYRFAHSEKLHKLIITDRLQSLGLISHGAIKADHEDEGFGDDDEPVGPDSVLYQANSGGDQAIPCLRRLRYSEQVRTARQVQRDHTFTHPAYRQEHRAAGPFLEHQSKDYEYFDYPGRYKRDAVGKPFTENRITALRHDVRIAEVQGDDVRLQPGLSFTLTDHPREDLNVHWRVSTVHHEGSQPTSLQEEAAGADQGTRYEQKAVLVPGRTEWRPAPLPKPRVDGPHMATVVGPPGEEIYCDEWGRVKVSFPWDRESQNNEFSSCWLRVSQGWAGGSWGSMAIPRIGQDVIIHYVNGDPDQPMITGRTYCGNQLPPYDLPRHKTRMTIKSQTHKGDGFNELRFEDELGQEEVFIHAQRDQNNVVKHDETTQVGNDRKEQVDNDESILIGHDRTETVGNDERITIGQDAALDIGRNHTIRIAKDRVENIGNHRHDQIAANHHTRIGGNFEQRVEGHAELEARGDIRRRTRRYELRASEAVVIQGPGGSIRIDETGITLDSPTIRITGQMLKSANGTTSPFSISSAPNTGKPLERLCGRRPDGSCPLPDCRCIRGQVQ